MPTDPLRALALVCSLKPSPAASSSQLIAEQLLAQMVRAAGDAGLETELVRVVDHDVRPGVELDMGDGDAWPEIREKVAAADILVVATPTWMGQQSSVCQRVLERLDAELSETDDEGRPTTFGKVAVAAVVGNEDGAHHITAILWQCLNDVGYTVPAQGVTYWNGEAMQGVDYNDLDSTPDATASTTAVAAGNAVFLAGLLRRESYPAVS